MSVWDTLWEVDMAHRKLAYGVLYLGMIESMVAIFLLPARPVFTYFGLALILSATFYIAWRMYISGYRRHAVFFTIYLLIVCAITFVCSSLVGSLLIAAAPAM